MADPKLASSARLRAGRLAVALLALSGFLHGQVAEAKSAAPQGGLAAGQVAGQGAPAKTVPSGKPAAKAKAQGQSQSQSQVKTKPKPAPAVPASKTANNAAGKSQAGSPAKVPVSRPATAPVPVADQQANPAQEAAPTEAPVADPRRYALVKVDGSYLRLDRVAGTIAFCKPANGVWRCMPSPDAEAAYLGEIDQLRQENAALRQEIAALKGNSDSGVPGRPSSEAPRGNTRPAPELSQKDEEQLDEMLSFTEQAMRRFFGLMRDLQRETGQ